MSRWIFALLTIWALWATAGCAKHYDVQTAPGFVRVDADGSAYDWRAVAPDGVAVALRVVKLDEPADLPFWAHAVALRMREMDGYALVATTEVRSRDGAPGKELLFGHDVSGRPFVYRVRLFLADRRLTMVEVGGSREQMDRYAASIDWMFSTVRVL
jgi:hypothetical protein